MEATNERGAFYSCTCSQAKLLRRNGPKCQASTPEVCRNNASLFLTSTTTPLPVRIRFSSLTTTINSILATFISIFPLPLSLRCASIFRPSRPAFVRLIVLAPPLSPDPRRRHTSYQEHTRAGREKTAATTVYASSLTASSTGHLSHFSCRAQLKAFATLLSSATIFTEPRPSSYTISRSLTNRWYPDLTSLLTRINLALRHLVYLIYPLLQPLRASISHACSSLRRIMISSPTPSPPWSCTTSTPSQSHVSLTVRPCSPSPRTRPSSIVCPRRCSPLEPPAI